MDSSKKDTVIRIIRALWDKTDARIIDLKSGHFYLHLLGMLEQFDKTSIKDGSDEDRLMCAKIFLQEYYGSAKKIDDFLQFDSIIHEDPIQRDENKLELELAKIAIVLIGIGVLDLNGQAIMSSLMTIPVEKHHDAIAIIQSVVQAGSPEVELTQRIEETLCVPTDSHVSQTDTLISWLQSTQNFYSLATKEEGTCPAVSPIKPEDYQGVRPKTPTINHLKMEPTQASTPKDLGKFWTPEAAAASSPLRVNLSHLNSSLRDIMSPLRGLNIDASLSCSPLTQYAQSPQLIQKATLRQKETELRKVRRQMQEQIDRTDELKYMLQDLQEASSEKDATIARLEREVKRLHKESLGKELKESADVENESTIDKLRQKIQSLEHFKSEYLVLEKESSTHATEMGKLYDEIASLEQKNSEYRSKLDSQMHLDEDVRDQLMQLRTSEENLNHLRRLQEDWHSERQCMQRTIESLKEQNAALRCEEEDFQTLEPGNASGETMGVIMDIQVREFKDQLDEANDERERLQNLLGEKQDLLNEKEHELKKIQQEQSKAQEKILEADKLAGHQALLLDQQTRKLQSNQIVMEKEKSQESQTSLIKLQHEQEMENILKSIQEKDNNLLVVQETLANNAIELKKCGANLEEAYSSLKEKDEEIVTSKKVIASLEKTVSEKEELIITLQDNFETQFAMEKSGHMKALEEVQDKLEAAQHGENQALAEQKETQKHLVEITDLVQAKEEDLEAAYASLRMKDEETLTVKRMLIEVEKRLSEKEELNLGLQRDFEEQLAAEKSVHRKAMEEVQSLIQAKEKDLEAAYVLLKVKDEKTWTAEKMITELEKGLLEKEELILGLQKDFDAQLACEKSDHSKAMKKLQARLEAAGQGKVQELAEQKATHEAEIAKQNQKHLEEMKDLVQANEKDLEAAYTLLKVKDEETLTAKNMITEIEKRLSEKEELIINLQNDMEAQFALEKSDHRKAIEEVKDLVQAKAKDLEVAYASLKVKDEEAMSGMKVITNLRNNLSEKEELIVSLKKDFDACLALEKSGHKKALEEVQDELEGAKRGKIQALAEQKATQKYLEEIKDLMQAKEKDLEAAYASLKMKDEEMLTVKKMINEVDKCLTEKEELIKNLQNDFEAQFALEKSDHKKALEESKDVVQAKEKDLEAAYSLLKVKDEEAVTGMKVITDLRNDLSEKEELIISLQKDIDARLAMEKSSHMKALVEVQDKLETAQNGEKQALAEQKEIQEHLEELKDLMQTKEKDLEAAYASFKVKDEETIKTKKLINELEKGLSEKEELILGLQRDFDAQLACEKSDHSKAMKKLQDELEAAGQGKVQALAEQKSTYEAEIAKENQNHLEEVKDLVQANKKDLEAAYASLKLKDEEMLATKNMITEVEKCLSEKEELIKNLQKEFEAQFALEKSDHTKALEEVKDLVQSKEKDLEAAYALLKVKDEEAMTGMKVITDLKNVLSQKEEHIISLQNDVEVQLTLEKSDHKKALDEVKDLVETKEKDLEAAYASLKVKVEETLTAEKMIIEVEKKLLEKEEFIINLQDNFKTQHTMEKSVHMKALEEVQDKLEAAQHGEIQALAEQKETQKQLEQIKDLMQAKEKDLEAAYGLLKVKDEETLTTKKMIIELEKRLSEKGELILGLQRDFDAQLACEKSEYSKALKELEAAGQGKVQELAEQKATYEAEIAKQNQKHLEEVKDLAQAKEKDLEAAYTSLKVKEEETLTAKNMITEIEKRLSEKEKLIINLQNNFEAQFALEKSDHMKALEDLAQAKERELLAAQLSLNLKDEEAMTGMKMITDLKNVLSEKEELILSLQKDFDTQLSLEKSGHIKALEEVQNKLEAAQHGQIQALAEQRTTFETEMAMLNQKYLEELQNLKQVNHENNERQRAALEEIEQRAEQQLLREKEDHSKLLEALSQDSDKEREGYLQSLLVKRQEVEQLNTQIKDLESHLHSQEVHLSDKEKERASMEEKCKRTLEQNALKLSEVSAKYEKMQRENKNYASEINRLKTALDFSERKLREYQKQLDRAGAALLGDSSHFQQLTSAHDNAVGSPDSTRSRHSLRSRTRLSSGSSTFQSGLNETILSGDTVSLNRETIASSHELKKRTKSQPSTEDRRSISSTVSTRSTRSNPGLPGIHMPFAACANEPEGPDFEWDRLSELQRRNTMYLPHMKSAYPVEMQTVEKEKLSDEGLRLSTVTEQTKEKFEVPTAPRESKLRPSTNVSLQQGSHIKSGVGSKTSKRSAPIMQLTEVISEPSPPKQRKPLEISPTGTMIYYPLLRTAPNYHRPGPPTPGKQPRRVSGSFSPEQTISPVSTGKSVAVGSPITRAQARLTPRTRTRRSPRIKTPAAAVSQDERRQSVAFNIGFSPMASTDQNRLKKKSGLLPKKKPTKSATSASKVAQDSLSTNSTQKFRRPLATRNFLETGI